MFSDRLDRIASWMRSRCSGRIVAVLEAAAAMVEVLIVGSSGALDSTGEGGFNCRLA